MASSSLARTLGLGGAGAFAGAIASSTGLAGALVIVPTLHNLTTLSNAVITGTTLCSTTVLSTIGTVSYLDRGLVDAPVALALGAVGSATSFAGVLAAQRLDNAAVGRCVKPALGVFLLCLAPTMYFRRRQSAGSSSVEDIMNARSKLGLFRFYQQQFSERHNVDAGLIISGGIGGLTQGFAAVGGGLIQTSYMTKNTDMNQHVIIATSLAATNIVNFFAASQYVRRRLVHTPTVGLVGAIGGCSLVACSYFSVKFPEEKLRTVFAAFLALSSALMIRSSLPLRMIKWKP